MHDFTHHSFGMLLSQLSRGWRAELDRRLSGLGLSQARWLVLLHVAILKDSPTQRELAQTVGVEGPTLARLLDGLEAQELVQRIGVPEDRRAKKVVLTDKARPLIDQIETIALQLRRELFSGIDEAELRMCQDIHAKIMMNMEKLKN